MKSMKSFRFFILAALVLALAPAVFAADFGVRVGRYNDSHENFVGADVLFDIGALNIDPNIEYSLEDNVTRGTANLDVTFDVVRFGRVRPYVGAGVGLLYTDDDVNGDTTEPIGNLLGGVQFDLGGLKPYAQVKYFRTLDNADSVKQDDVALAVGLRF
jgi:opacity protein-like surface antigen